MNKIKTLMPLSKFVSKIDELCPVEVHEMSHDHEGRQLELIKRYNNFLLQPLNIGMFVPADEDGNIVTEPSYRQYEESNDLEDLYKIYNNAKNSVLFDGFKVIASNDDGIELELNDEDIWIIVLSTSISIQYYNGESWEIKTVIEMLEFLKEYGSSLTLTEQAIKQIYG